MSTGDKAPGAPNKRAAAAARVEKEEMQNPVKSMFLLGSVHSHSDKTSCLFSSQKVMFYLIYLMKKP